MTAAIIIFSLNGFDTRPIRSEAITCDPENHEYYNEQFKKCGECDRCWEGQEIELKGADLGMGVRGATKCPNCRDCGHGTYNPNGDVYWYCIPCTVCEKLGQYEIQACSKIQDTKCNKTAPTSNQRPFPENLKERPKREDEEPHKEEVSNIEYWFVGLLGAALIGCAISMYVQKKRLCHRHEDMPVTNISNEEMTPLRSPQIGGSSDRPGQQNESSVDESDSDSASDQLSSLRDNNVERRSLLVPRQRHHSCSDYQSTGCRSDTSTGRERKAPGHTNPSFQRQISLPITSSEVGNTIKQLDKKRPTEKFLHLLSKLLAPNEKYKKFVKQMGTDGHRIEVLKEELKKQRNLAAQDLAFAHITTALNCKRSLCCRDIYKALDTLGMQKELTTLKEKRRKLYNI